MEATDQKVLILKVHRACVCVCSMEMYDSNMDITEIACIGGYKCFIRTNLLSLTAV